MKNKKRVLRLLLVVISCFIMTSCSTTYTREKFSYVYINEKNAWIESYKYKVFYSCFKEGMQNDTILKMIDKKDFFDINDDAIDVRDLDKASALGKKIIKNLPRAIIQKCDECTEKEQKENLLKKYISSNCVKYYASKELDSIAKKAYKEHLKNEKE